MTSLGRRLRRNDGHAAAMVGEQPQDVALDAEVVRDDVQPLARARACGPCSSCQFVPSFHWYDALGRHDLGEIHALEPGELAGRVRPQSVAPLSRRVMMQPACAPFSRRMRVSLRVSISAIATTLPPLQEALPATRRRASSSARSGRSRMIRPAA